MLVKHVLKAIPLYHLLALTLNQEGFRGLEQICREFLWGPRESGQTKVPLVTWTMLSRPTLEGGLGL